MAQAPERLTVFLLTYNHKKYIQKCFDSILSQKTDCPFKVIVLDDSSTDGTSDIVRDYVQRYPDKVTAVINERNLGVVENVYRALCKIDTEYFTILEGDDYWCDDTKIQSQIRLLDAHPECDICGHDAFVKHFEKENMSRMYDYDTAGKSDVIIFEGRFMPKAHPSSRVYRAVYDFSKVSPKAAAVFDSCLFWFYCLQNPKFIFINRPLSVYNYTGEGLYSGAGMMKQKLMAMRNIVALNEALGYKYEDFNYKRFKKALLRRHRPLFSLMYLFDKKRAYDWFVEKYAQ